MCQCVEGLATVLADSSSHVHKLGVNVWWNRKALSLDFKTASDPLYTM